MPKRQRPMFEGSSRSDVTTAAMCFIVAVIFTVILAVVVSVQIKNERQGIWYDGSQTIR